MLLTGYHGTTETSARSILEQKEFHVSHGDKEWLGSGIYFYEKFSDAFAWEPLSDGSESVLRAVLHAVVNVPDEAYLDIDSPEGEKIWMDIIDYICDTMRIRLTGTIQQKQCAVCNILWDINPELQVLEGSFGTPPSRIATLIDKRRRRREFCCRSNDSIKAIQIIDYKE